MTFTSDGSKFPDVPHIQNDEKAFGTRNLNTSPGKQLQALCDRTEYARLEIIRVLRKLGIEDPVAKSILDLIIPLSQLLDDDGKMPFNRLLATDEIGNITTIPIPRVSFIRTAVANFTASSPQALTPDEWALRRIEGVISTKPSGINPDWVVVSGGRIVLNSPGQYLINVAVIGGMVDAHQVRINRDGTIFNGILTQTASSPVVGHTILTMSQANAAFTIGVKDSPPIPANISIEHWAARSRGDIDAGFASTLGSVPLYIVGSITHTTVETLSITDNKTIIQEFNP
ncbi:MAG: hypothetical protein AAF378_19025 [Cyanobacteria bacterium P01_A01_bin.84]